MHGDRQVGRLAGERLVDHARVGGGQFLRVVAALARVGKFALVAHHRPCGVVELQIAAAGVVEGAYRFAKGIRRVVEEGREIGIGFFADRAPSLAEMQHAGRRNGHFRHDPRVLFDETEIMQMRMRGKADLAGRAHALGLGFHAMEGNSVVDAIKLDAIEILEKVELPP